MCLFVCVCGYNIAISHNVCFVSYFIGQYALDDVVGIRQYSPAAASMVNPAFGATATAAAYFATSGPRVAALAGTLGFGAVAATYTAYTVLGLPYGSRGYLFF